MEDIRLFAQYKHMFGTRLRPPSAITALASAVISNASGVNTLLSAIERPPSQFSK